ELRDIDAGGGRGVAVYEDQGVYVWEPHWQLTDPLDGIRAVAVDESGRYAATDDEIRRFGSDAGPLGVAVAPASCPQNLGVGPTHVYWTDATCRTSTHPEIQTRLLRAPKEGGEPSVVVD